VVPTTSPPFTPEVQAIIDMLQADKEDLRQQVAALTAEVRALREALTKGKGPAEAPPPAPAQKIPNQGHVNKSGVGGRHVPGHAPASVVEQEPEFLEQLGQEWQEVRRGHKQHQPQPGKSPATPADQAKTDKKRKQECHRAVEAALGPPATPVEFVSIFFKLGDARPLLRAVGPERNCILRQLFHKLDIYKYVAGATIVPGPTIHILAPIGANTLIQDTLKAANLEICINVDPFAPPPHSRQSEVQAQEATARRLAALCRRSQSRNFQEKVLERATPELRAATLAEYRKTAGAEAQLGHAGRWYSAPAAAIVGESGEGLDALMGEHQQ